MSHDQRQRTFVDAKVQGTLARRLIWHWCLFLFAACGATFLLEVFLNPFEEFNVKLHRIWRNHGPFLLTAIFLVPVFVRDAVRLSHRFVGPISRLRTSLGELASTPLQSTPLKLRPNDFWQDLAVEFNNVRERMVQLEQTSASALTRESTNHADEGELAIR